MQDYSIELKFQPSVDGSYHVEFTGGIAGKSPAVIIVTSISAFNSECYPKYQQACRKYEQTRLGLKSTQVRTQEDIDRIRQQVEEAAADLQNALDRWGKLPEFRKIATAIDQQRSEHLQVKISTDCPDLRKLPFHQWQLFPENIEVIFSGIEAKVLERIRHPDRIRILVILGDTTGIDLDKDQKAIEQYCQDDAELVFLAQPDREILTTTLADIQGWDIIFFSGHSCTEGDRTGRIFISATDSLTMAELKDVLKPAIEQRVQIAIFNSCDGLGIAPELERLNIDRLIVMREPIPDPIAQEFLKSFLKAFTGGARFDDAVKSARQQLVSFEDRYPYVSWLPIVIQNRLVTSPTWQSLGKIRSPYKGLEAFTEADAGNFYGREETIERYAKLVAESPLVPIIGASGSGKSSLVQAGLIPFLKQDAASDWQILTMRPGRNPFNALAQAIFNAKRSNLETIQLDVDLASDRHLLTQKLAQIRMPQHRILLFIDQFEELFTQSEDEAARQVFLQSLVDAVHNAPNFVLVFTLRSDFLPTLQSDRQDKDFTGLLGRFGLQSFVGGMTHAQFKAVITKPVEQLGVEFEGGLVDRLIKDVGTADGSLPLLQLVLDLLWKNVQKRQLTHECYDAIGGKDGMKTVLIKLADDVYSGFVKRGQVKEFKQVFLRLVTLGDANILNTRRIATRAEIEASGDNWRKIVVPLSTSSERLLKTDLNEKDEEIVEVIHETVIQSWQQLTGWIENHRHELKWITEIEAAATKWDLNKRSKQDLWVGKKFKTACKFTRQHDHFLKFKPTAKDFLVASGKQHRSNKLPSLMLRMIVIGLLGGWAARGSLIAFSILKINTYPKDKCESSQLLPAFGFLKMMEYPLSGIDLQQRDLRCINFTGGDPITPNNIKILRPNFIDNIPILNDVFFLITYNLPFLARSDSTEISSSRFDFRGARFMGADLRGVNFRDVSFGSYKDFDFVSFSGANLSGANLSGANLRGAFFSGANLSGANLSGAIMPDSRDVDGANLSGANLSGADFTSYDGDNGVTQLITQIKRAKNWRKAKYGPEIQKKLGLK
jgi:uncharacterized protein YjbI with pentapeptide repeats